MTRSQQFLIIFSNLYHPLHSYVPPPSLQRLKGLRSDALVNAVDEIEVPRLAVTGSRLFNPLHTGVIVGLGRRTGRHAVLPKLRQVADWIFFFRLVCFIAGVIQLTNLCGYECIPCSGLIFMLVCDPIRCRQYRAKEPGKFEQIVDEATNGKRYRN